MKTKLLLLPIARLLLAIVVCLPVWSSNMFAQTTESYVVLDNAAGTLTFKHDANKPAGAFSLNEGKTFPAWYDGDGTTEYNKNNITKVVFDPSFANARPTNCFAWFFACKDLATIEGLEYLNTEKVTNMNSIFSNCPSLTSLDLSNFKTQNVMDMTNMFIACNKLTSLNVSKFDTRNVTDMSFMFALCQELTSLDISNFDTENVTNMGCMFYGCEKLTSLDVSKFKTEKVTNMSSMFQFCNGLTSLNISNFDTRNVTSMENMFYSCMGLTSLDISHFNTESVKNMHFMFVNCRSLTSLDVSNFKTENVTNMTQMFEGCSGLTSLNVSNFNTENVMYMGNMFNNCIALTSLDLSYFDTKNVTNMSWMFTSCSNLTTIYTSDKFVTTACLEDAMMFRGCKKLVGAVPYDENKVGKEMANYTTGYFTYKASTGIDAVSATDNISAEYYDMGGRRLNAPQKGINIMKRGNRTTKVLMK